MSTPLIPDSIIEQLTSEQVVFSHILQFMRKQGEPAFGGLHCLYRVSKDDKMLACAAGACIPDSRMSSEDVERFKYKGINNLISNFEAYMYLKPFKALLEQCQLAHDLARFDENFIFVFEQEMQRIADKFNLQFSVDTP